MVRSFRRPLPLGTEQSLSKNQRVFVTKNSSRFARRTCSCRMRQAHFGARLPLKLSGRFARWRGFPLRRPHGHNVSGRACRAKGRSAATAGSRYRRPQSTRTGECSARHPAAFMPAAGNSRLRRSETHDLASCISLAPSLNPWSEVAAEGNQSGRRVASRRGRWRRSEARRSA